MAIPGRIMKRFYWQQMIQFVTKAQGVHDEDAFLLFDLGQRTICE